MARPPVQIDVPEDEISQLLPDIADKQVARHGTMLGAIGQTAEPLPAPANFTGDPSELRTKAGYAPPSFEDVMARIQDDPPVPQVGPLIRAARPNFEQLRQDMVEDPFGPDNNPYEVERQRKILHTMSEHDYDRNEATFAVDYGQIPFSLAEAQRVGFEGAIPEPLRGHSLYFSGLGAKASYLLGNSGGDIVAVTNNMWNAVTTGTAGAASYLSKYLQMKGQEYAAGRSSENVDSPFGAALGAVFGNTLVEDFFSRVSDSVQNIADVSNFFVIEPVGPDGEPSEYMSNRPYLSAIGAGLGSVGTQVGLMATTGPAVALTYMFGSEAGLMLNAVEERGWSDDDDEAMLMATAGGVLALGFEWLPFHRLASALAKRQTRTAREKLVDIGITSLAEGATETLTTFGQASLFGIQKYSHGLSADFTSAMRDEMLSEETLLEAKLSFVAGVFAGGLMSAAINTQGLRAEKAGRAALSQQLVDVKNYIDNSGASRQVVADYFETLDEVVTETKGVPAGKVYMDFDGWRGLFQNDEDAIKAAVELGFPEEEVSQAATNGTVLEIRLADALMNLTSEQLAELPYRALESKAAPSRENLVVRSTALTAISEYFNPSRTDPILSSTAVADAYRRVDAFAEQAYQAWADTRKAPPADSTRKSKINEFRNIGFLLEARASVIEETFGIPRQSTWYRWNLEVVGDPSKLGVEYKNLPKGARGGFLQMDGKSLVLLFEKNDKTTLLHELGHMFLQDLDHLSALPQAPVRLKADLQAVRRFLDSPDGTEFTTKQQERFARQWEAYLFEGKSPSGGVLDTVMNRFSRWLKGVYKTVLKLGGKVDPELSGVFDRMLATEGQIQYRLNQQGYINDIAMLFELNKAGADIGGELGNLSAWAAEVIGAAQAALDKQKMRAHRTTMRNAKNWANAQWAADPVTKMLNYFATKDSNGERGLNLQWALDSYGRSGVDQIRKARGNSFVSPTGKSVEAYFHDMHDQFSPERFFALLTQTPNKKLYVQNKIDEYLVEHDSKLDSEQARLLEQEELDEAIQAQIAKSINTLFGTSLTPKPINTIRKEAAERGVALTEEELNARRDKLLGATMQITSNVNALLDTVRAFTFINNMDTSTPEAQAYKEAAQAKLNTDLAGIASTFSLSKGEVSFVKTLTDMYNQKEKLRELRVSMRLAQEQKDFAKYAAKTLNTMYKRATKGKFFSSEYGSAISNMIAILDKRRTTDLQKHGDAIRAFLDQNRIDSENGLDSPVLFSDTTRQVLEGAKVWDQLTYAEKSSVFEDLQSLAKQGRKVYKFNAEQKAMNLDEAAKLLADSIDSVTSLRSGYTLFAEDGTILSKHQRRGRRSLGTWLTTNSYFNLFQRMEFIIDRLGGTEGLNDIHAMVNSPVYKALFEPFNKSFDAKVELLEKSLSILDNAYSRYETREGHKHFYEMVTFSNGTVRSRQEIFAIMLNIGTQGGLDAVTGKHSKGGKAMIQESVLSEAKSKLTADDWQAIQEVWRAVGTLAKPLADKFKTMTGRDLTMVEGIKVKTPYGEIEGSYFPLVPDREVQHLSSMYQLDVMDSVVNMVANAKESMTPAVGAIHERKGGMWAVSLDASLASQHINKVAHWITHIEELANVAALLKHPDVQEALNDSIGPKGIETITDWLTYIANPKDSGTRDLFSRAVRYVRTGASFNFIGWSLKTVFTIGSGNIFMSMSKIPMSYVARSLGTGMLQVKNVVGNKFNPNAKTLSEGTIWGRMFEKSPLARELLSNPDRAAREYVEHFGRNAFENFTKLQQSRLLKYLHVNPNNLAEVQRMKHKISRMTWEIMSVAGAWQMGIIWDAAYNHAWDGLKHIENIEQRDAEAIREADAALRMTNPAFGEKDVPFLQRGTTSEWLKTFGTLSSDTMTASNLILSAVACVGNQKYASAFLIFLPLMLQNAWMEYLNQLFQKKPIDPGEIVLHGALGPVIDNFLLVKDAYFGYESYVRSGGKNMDILPMNPAFRLISSLYTMPSYSMAFFTSDDTRTQKDAARALERNMFDVVGVMFNLPGSAMRKAWEGAQRLYSGETSNPMVLFGYNPSTED